MKSPAFDAILKLGGSLYDSPALPSLLRTLSRVARRRRVLVVPGGGPFAEAVRRAWRKHRLSEAAAHRMALLGMDQYALLLCDLQPGAVPVRTLAQAAAAAGSGRLPVLLAARLAAADRGLPASWDVTSDSVAAWVARHTGAARLILLKSVTVRAFKGTARSGRVARRGPGARRLASAGIVDRAFPAFVSRLPECWVVNGQEPRSVLALLEGSRSAGVRQPRSPRQR